MSYQNLQPRRALLHIDADAFFATTEQMIHPAWKGRPVITGKERKIVAAASYEAKRLGVTRGVSLWDAVKMAPGAIVVPSDYETYSLISKRMYDIMRKYSPAVEEYSIDEAFVDITGLRRYHRMSYPKIALTLKKHLEAELGITLSVGLSMSKTLCKIASKWNKPSGFVVIGRHNLQEYLQQVPIVDVWNIGHATANFLIKFGFLTAWDFAQASEEWVRGHLTKPHIQCWEELNGRSMIGLELEEKQRYQSIGKSKTFSPPSSNPTYVFAQLSKNIENAFIKARRYNLGSRHMFLFLRKNDYTYSGVEVHLSRVTRVPVEVIEKARELFRKIFSPTEIYRSTGVMLLDMESCEARQLDIFQSPLVIERQERIFAAVDQLAAKFGKHSLFMGSSLSVHMNPDDRQRTRNVKGEVSKKLRIRETRKYLELPLLDIQLTAQLNGLD